MNKTIKELKAMQTKPIKRLRHLLTYGNLWLYILSLIRKKKKIYAYSLNDQIEKEFSFKPSKVMTYIVLYKLEKEKLIVSEFKERRRYYKLTKKGKNTISFAKRYFEILAKMI